MRTNSLQELCLLRTGPGQGPRLAKNEQSGKYNTTCSTNSPLFIKTDCTESYQSNSQHVISKKRDKLWGCRSPPNSTHRTTANCILKPDQTGVARPDVHRTAALQPPKSFKTQAKLASGKRSRLPAICVTYASQTRRGALLQSRSPMPLLLRNEARWDSPLAKYRESRDPQTRNPRRGSLQTSGLKNH